MKWDVAAERVSFYMGRHPDPDLDGHPDNLGTWEKPTEAPDSGCPGGYQRCRFVLALARFYRRRDEHGGRVVNPLFDRCDDWLVMQAVLYREQEEEACIADRNSLWDEIRDRPRT